MLDPWCMLALMERSCNLRALGQGKVEKYMGRLMLAQRGENIPHPCPNREAEYCSFWPEVIEYWWGEILDFPASIRGRECCFLA
jgi:hypothetical protein